MEIYQGNRISAETAIGIIRVRKERTGSVPAVPVSDAETEVARYEEAVRIAAAELRALSQKAGREIGSWNAKIFDAHAMMTEDVDYRSEVSRIIRTGKLCAEYAVWQTGRHFASLFEEMEDPYFQARAQDVRDITERLIRILSGEKSGAEEGLPYILAVTELTPGELMRQERRMLLGVVSEQGTAYSHASILARSMNIPVVTGIPIDPAWDGQRAILDGTKGKLIIAPDASTVSEYLRLTAERAGRLKREQEDASEPVVTKSGKRIPLRANAGDEADLKAAVSAGAEGIGLLRSEYLFLHADRLPDEEEQLVFYRNFAEAMKGKKVVIRTIDIGADKPVPYLSMPREENPALGMRAIRLSLKNEELFRTQLRAIFRAGQYGDVCVLYPMITSEKEMKRIICIEEEVRAALLSEGIRAGEMKRGIMIETPAAAIISDRLSEYADFFSIGTNDLAQYVLAVDRMNSAVSGYYDPWHEAITRLLSTVIGNAHKKGIPVCLCGELAADPEATERLLKLGVDELSVSPSLIPEIRRAIRASSV